MKLLLVIFLLISVSWARTHEDFVYATGKKLEKRRFFEIIRLLKNEFQELAVARGTKFEIFADYDSDWAQAFARRWDTDHILVYGGLAAIPNVTEDAFALVLCHEIGHLYGGRPYSDEHNELSVEGQADYWSASCFERILPKLPHREGNRLQDAALVLTSFYADNRNIPHPEVHTPDVTVVSSTLKTHPEPQCRLDTILAGLTRGPRPLCWYFPE